MKISQEKLLEHADALFKGKEYPKASDICQKLIAENPKCHKAMNILGVISLRLQDYQRASDLFRQAIVIDRKNDLYINNLAVAWQNLGKYNEAIAAARESIQINPKSPTGYNILGDLCNITDRKAEAIKCLQKSFSIHASAKTALYLGMILVEMGHVIEGVNCFHKAIELDPKYLHAYVAAAGALSSIGRFEEAIKACTLAEERGLKSKELYCNHGVARMGLQHVREGIEYNLKALALDPAYKVSIINMADYAAHSCDWDLVEKYEKEALRLTKDSLEDKESPHCIQPFTGLRMDISPALQRRITEKYVNRKHKCSIYSGPKLSYDGQRKIRVGYLSSDFRNHPVFHLAKNLFKRHDKDRFETFAYSIGPDDASEYRQHIERTCAHFIDLRDTNNTQAIEKMKSDQLDILVDMNGVTTMNRIALVAARPAPVQIHFLGYPGTIGLDCIDYFVTDHYLTPPGSEDHFKEKLIYMPDTYQICDDEQVPEQIEVTRSEENLPENTFVFCSFNSNYKIDRPVFECWMNILRRVPNSVLWLLERPELAIENLLKAFEKTDIDVNRIIVAKRKDKASHLARHALADLFLDTHVVCGHTTANDALQMGLPVLAYPGETFISRVSSDLLMAHDLPELICNSYQEYEDLAVELADDKERLKQIRDKLTNEGPGMPARNTKRFVMHLEMAYEKALQLYANAEAPKHIDVAELATAEANVAG